MLQPDSMMNKCKHLVLATALSVLAFNMNVAHADESAGGLSTGDPAEGSMYIPYGNLKNASKADIEHATQVGQDVVKDLMNAYEKRKDDPDLATAMQHVKERADQISDEAIAASRDKVLDFLGLDPESQNAVYYFVSWSMPLDMLRSYAIEAMWDGGTLVFKGLPPGRSFGQYMSEDLSKLAYGKGASANVSIDPRLFDAYEVTTVPTIVLTTYRANFQCTGVAPMTFTYQGQQISYDTCPALDASKYVKLSGAVTSNYALQAFVDDGWPQAKPFLKALAKGFALGETPQKEQKAFTGKWEDVLSPTDRMTADQATQTMLDATGSANLLPSAGSAATPPGVTPPPVSQ